MTSYKALFQKSLSAHGDMLHLCAHSHHLWPDAGYHGHLAALEDAIHLSDQKWGKVFSAIYPEAQTEVAKELRLSDPGTIVFTGNTHEALVRLISAKPLGKPLKVLTSDGEFHSFRRQADAFEEAGRFALTRVPVHPFDSFSERFLRTARAGKFDLIVISQGLFRTGQQVAPSTLAALADLASSDGTWVVIDGYHGFMATPTDLSKIEDKVFYLAGGYKYAMSGEGAGFMHAPKGYGLRPAITSWYSEFSALSGPKGALGYPTDAGRFLGATFDPTALYRFIHVRRMLAEQDLSTAAISAKVTHLLQDLQGRIYQGRLGILAEGQILNPVEDGHSARARYLAIRHPKAQTLKTLLDEIKVHCDVRNDTLRLGLGLYHDESDLDLFEARLKTHPGLACQKVPSSGTVSVEETA